MATKELKTYSLGEMKDKYIGKVGTQERDEYEYELRMDVLGKMINFKSKLLLLPLHTPVSISLLPMVANLLQKNGS